jgi:hypothetical protein
MRSINAIEIAILLILVVAFSCGQIPSDGGDNVVSTFPLTPGTRWAYERNYYEIPFNNPLNPDTTAFFIVRRVIGPEPTMDSLHLIIVDDTTWDNYPNQNSYVQRYWYKLENGKLREYGSRMITGGGSIEPILYDFPATILNLPLTPNKEWLVVEGALGSIVKKVIDTDNYSYGGRQILSAVLRTSRSYLPNVDWVELYSNEGLMYSHIYYGIQPRNDEVGNPIDSVYVHDDIRLVGMDIGE